MRDKLDISQARLAQLLGVHALTVSKWERGVLEPSDYQTALLEEFRFAAQFHPARLADQSPALGT